ncbi:hypothetical protein PHISCL_03607 [Aspergillus sclerotialis]|uniref:Uncharacterized protein n=1 Tax=Aspergillus sclerotialis TaxID=2070753 RepID=A0A3A3A3Z8_9EURO|nr:hypothetical protein PHISCL_03607 [Aspergillus sclerotialis]
MHLFMILSSLLLLTSPGLARKAKRPATTTAPSAAASTSGCTPTSGDASVMEFAYALEDLGAHFYSSTPLNSSAFSGAPNDSNAAWFPNFRGMAKQSNLSLMAIEELGNKTPTYKAPACNFTLPHASSPRMLLDTTYYMESSLCGAYIGLAGYSESPEVSFLMARLAAGHSGHATYVQGHLMEPIYSDTNVSLVPAYPPEHVLTPGMSPGMLGDFLGKCVRLPVKPCGNTLIVDATSGNLTNNPTLISSAMATQTAT